MLVTNKQTNKQKYSMKLTSLHTNKQAPNQRLSVTRTIAPFGDDYSDVDNDDNEYDEGNNDDVCFWF